MTLRTMHRYGSTLTRPVRYRSETGLHTPTVGTDRIRPKRWILASTRLNGLAPLKGLAAVAIYGVQMLNAELELAARTG